MLPGIAEIIIAGEENSSRFEKFCAELCEMVEGFPFVTTSRSYDRGRDGIGLARSKGTHANVVLCTLNKSTAKNAAEYKKPQ